MNKCFDTAFPVREDATRCNYEIDDDFYNELEALSKYYQATVTDLVNICIEQLLKTENIVIYKKENELLVKHTLFIRRSNTAGLSRLSASTGVSIYRLVNIAIRNALKDL